MLQHNPILRPGIVDPIPCPLQGNYNCSQSKRQQIQQRISEKFSMLKLFQRGWEFFRHWLFLHKGDLDVTQLVNLAQKRKTALGCSLQSQKSSFWETINSILCTNTLPESLEAEGKGTKASEGKCGHVKRGVVGRVQSCLGTPSTLCLSSTFKRWQYSKAGNSIREIQDIVPKLNIQEVTVQQGRE